MKFNDMKQHDANDWKSRLGMVKEGEIIVQGAHRDRIVEILLRAGYGCKKAGG